MHSGTLTPIGVSALRYALQWKGYKMGSLFEVEKRKWDDEVDVVAARLVRKGTPPYEALIRARNAVSTKRKREARNNAKGKENEINNRKRKIRAGIYPI